MAGDLSIDNEIESPVAGREILLLIDPSRLYEWHVKLAGELRRRGAEVRLLKFTADKRRAGGGFNQLGFDLLLRTERLIYGGGQEKSSNMVDPRKLGIEIDDFIPTAHGDGGDQEKVLVNLAGYELAGNGVDESSPYRILTPYFNGVAGDMGACNALLKGGNVEILVRDSAIRGKLWQARPAIEDRGVVFRGLDNVLSRAADLLLKALEEKVVSDCLLSEEEADFTASAVSVRDGLMVAGAGFGQKLAGKVRHRLLKTVSAPEAWSVAWRRTSGPGLMLAEKKERASYNIIPDDGQRFYADPFIFQKDGVSYIFVEEYPYATGKGIISVFTLDQHGNLSPARPVLERPHHLSYPHIIEHDGQIWMVPEGGAGGKVEIYRAVDFPYEWRLEGALLENVAGYDATFCQHQGRWWMFLSTDNHDSSSWDNLLLFHAEDLFGEWQPHASNPVIIDALLSRPGGEMISHQGDLLRPAQDGSLIYGGGLSICRVDRLDNEEFSQTLLGSMAPVGNSDIYGVHTINCRGDLEVVDITGRMGGKYDRVDIEYTQNAAIRSENGLA